LFFGQATSLEDIARTANQPGELLGNKKVDRARRVRVANRSSYVLESAAGVLARAEQPSVWFRELVIEHSGHQYALRAKSAFRSQLLLLEGSTQIGSLSPQGLFARKASVELPKAFPLFLQVFIIWLAMTLWKQEDSSGAG
jgi:hypothetical protein